MLAFGHNKPGTPVSMFSIEVSSNYNGLLKTGYEVITVPSIYLGGQYNGYIC